MKENKILKKKQIIRQNQLQDSTITAFSEG
jgi:hypothetical protein